MLAAESVAELLWERCVTRTRRGYCDSVRPDAVVAGSRSAGDEVKLRTQSAVAHPGREDGAVVENLKKTVAQIRSAPDERAAVDAFKDFRMGKLRTGRRFDLGLAGKDVSGNDQQRNRCNEMRDSTRCRVETSAVLMHHE